MIETILNQSKPITLNDYHEHVEGILNEAIEYDENLISYVKNNLELVEKLKFDLKINKKLFNFIQTVEEERTILVILEPWCLDAIILLPFFEALSTINDKIVIQIYLRDNNPELMNQFLTNGGKSIPVVFELDSSNQMIWKWGSRSEKAKLQFETVKSLELDDKIAAMKSWYLEDKTMSAQEEIYDLLYQWK